MKYTIKNIISLFFFSIAMRVARFCYKYVSEESQKKIGIIFEHGAKPLVADLEQTTRKIKNARYCIKCGGWLFRET